MTPERLLSTAIAPALLELQQCGISDSPEARRFLLAIALQESALTRRRQLITGAGETGPAASFWQFEQGGGCKGVLTHFLVAPCMRRMCEHYNVAPTPQGLWEAMRYQDIVAAIAARLLVYTLPGKLPTTADAGWAQYLEAWRPGKPHPQTWSQAWDTATEIVGGI